MTEAAQIWCSELVYVCRLGTRPSQKLIPLLFSRAEREPLKALVLTAPALQSFALQARIVLTCRGGPR